MTASLIGRLGSGAFAQLGRADRLAHARHQLVELARPCRADQRVDGRGKFVLRRDRDAGLALLELDRLRAVEHGQHKVATRVRSPPGAHALLLLDLAPLVALAGPALDGAHVGRVLQEGLLLLQPLGELGSTADDGVVRARRDAGESEGI